MPKCKHYNGCLMNEECRAGIRYTDLVPKGFGWVKKLPCSSWPEDDPVECLSFEKETLEEAEERLAKIPRAIDAALKIRKEIGEVGISGFVFCPICNAEVDWVRSERNGHVHAKCRTENCISFME